MHISPLEEKIVIKLPDLLSLEKKILFSLLGVILLGITLNVVASSVLLCKSRKKNIKLPDLFLNEGEAQHTSEENTAKQSLNNSKHSLHPVLSSNYEQVLNSRLCIDFVECILKGAKEKMGSIPQAQNNCRDSTQQIVSTLPLLSPTGLPLEDISSAANECLPLSPSESLLNLSKVDENKFDDIDLSPPPPAASRAEDAQSAANTSKAMPCNSFREEIKNFKRNILTEKQIAEMEEKLKKQAEATKKMSEENGFAGQIMKEVARIRKAVSMSESESSIEDDEWNQDNNTSGPSNILSGSSVTSQSNKNIQRLI